MEYFLEGSALLSFGKFTQKKRLVFVTLLIWFNVPMHMSERSNSFKEM